MANPQKENGFTPLANEILEAVSGASLNGTQLRILLLLWRNSYGFHKKDCPLPLSYLEKMLNGNKSTIAREVKKLSELGVISYAMPKSDGHTPKYYRFNKDYTTWKCGHGFVNKQTLGTPEKLSRVSLAGYGESAKEQRDKDFKKKKYKYNFNTQKQFKSRYNYDEIEKITFQNVTKRLTDEQERNDLDD